jgi:hypothetical protein
MLFMLFLGCIEPLIEEVQLSGILTEIDDSSAAPVEGGEVATYFIWDEEVDCVEADEAGRFSVIAPASSSFFVQTHATGRVQSSFTGWIGIEDTELDPGVLWVRGVEDLDEIRAEFTGCEGHDQAGAIVEGRVRVYLPVDEPVDALPIVTTASVTVMDQDGNTTEACYLDDDGNSDPEATLTGETGRFAVFGLEEGLAWVNVAYIVDDDFEEAWDYPILLAENGTAPMYPVLVALP